MTSANYTAESARRSILADKPATISVHAPKETIAIAKVVARLASDIAYREAALEMHGARAVELARRGRSLRALARSSGLSPTYLSRVALNQITISPGALLALLREMEGANDHARK